MKVWSVNWTQGVTLSTAHLFEQNFYSYIDVYVFQLDSKGHTFYIALFLAKFQLIQSSGGLVCQLGNTSSKNKRSNFPCCTSLSKIDIHIYLWWLGLLTLFFRNILSCGGLVCQLDHTCLHKQKGHTFLANFLEQYFY